MEIDEDNVEMFEVFCRLHPIEAYDLNKEKFYAFMHKEYPSLTDYDIDLLITEYRPLDD